MLDNDGGVPLQSLGGSGRQNVLAASEYSCSNKQFLGIDRTPGPGRGRLSWRPPQPSPVMPTSPATSLAGHELAAWRGMLEAHARVTQQLDAQMHAEHGLSLSAYEVLMFLADAPEHRLRMSEIAKAVLLSRSGCTRLVERLGLSAAAVSEQVNRLVDQGYLTRHAATTDGRGLYAQLTDTGLNKVNAARSTHHQGIRQFFLEHLTTTDQIALGDIWTRLQRHSTTTSEDHSGAQPAALSNC